MHTDNKMTKNSKNSKNMTGNLEYFWGNLKEHPQCSHGPTLLFGRQTNGDLKKFFACSACRDRKLCSFYLEYGKTLEVSQNKFWEQEKKRYLSVYRHKKLFIFFNELMSLNQSRRAYCHKCEKLISSTEKESHQDHDLLENLSDYQMAHPTEFMKPLDNSKKEAQYLFSLKATEDIVNLLSDLGAENVLCIGAPRIHEYITENMDGRISSLLLDLDGRFHNFFGPLSFCWYNLFNHHFFNKESKQIFKDFLMQNGGKNTFVVCDPPFGGRVEPISQTLKTIATCHKRWNKLNEETLKIFFIFPYFMESVMQQKSNQPNISGGLKDLKMTDYKVTYDNHPLFVSEKSEQGSQVRIFTNVKQNLFKLPEVDGYKFCKPCERWVSQENKHCTSCKACTSKDGRTYKHCDLCERCVKPTWVHCKKCDRCRLENHACGGKPKIGRCFKCNEIGHTEKECLERNMEAIKTNKRKNVSSKIDNNEIPRPKKIKQDLENPEDFSEEEGNSKNDNESSLSKSLKRKEKKEKKKKALERLLNNRPTIEETKRIKIKRNKKHKTEPTL